MSTTPRRPIITCDVATIGQPDLATLDRLCRLSASVRGLGAELRLCRSSAELWALIALSGLTDALPDPGGVPVEPRGEAKERKEARRVEEEGDTADPVP